MRYTIFFLIFLPNILASIDEEWQKFKIYYKKTYSSQADEQEHYENFKENLNEIELHNRLFEKGQVSYRKGITKFADLTDDEFVAKYRFDKRPPKIYLDEPGYESSKNASDRFDWREKGAVSKVKNQDTCGACWIFASVGALEGLYFRKTNKSIVLSEQNLIDCISNHTCKGGWPETVFQYIYSGKGINTEDDYPRTPSPGQCKFQKLKNVPLTIKDVGFVKNDEEALKKALVKKGPIVLCLYAGEKWKLYESGVWYERECSDIPNHAVLLVGYGSENGHDYWLIKNSHSEDWGENGYIKIARNKHRNYCSITKFAIYVE
ncbi:unnamed protein product [Phyllotreta striolata]|uniref:Uncharacterized protein n=1 Tax=Phyllotreta striolata TaxID=444603 RepID=A0A9N9XKR0_PHYSR|nr:unnamed protein product [Phyllotreta striolata]